MEASPQSMIREPADGPVTRSPAGSARQMLLECRSSCWIVHGMAPPSSSRHHWPYAGSRAVSAWESATDRPPRRSRRHPRRRRRARSAQRPAPPPALATWPGCAPEYRSPATWFDRRLSRAAPRHTAAGGAPTAASGPRPQWPNARSGRRRGSATRRGRGRWPAPRGPDRAPATSGPTGARARGECRSRWP